jgi:uncharacterized protein
VENVRVTDNPDEGRFELYVDGELAGWLEYRVRGDRVLLLHTEVDSRFRGRGCGERLVHDVLADLEARGQEYKAYCPFVIAYLRDRAA